MGNFNPGVIRQRAESLLASVSERLLPTRWRRFDGPSQRPAPRSGSAFGGHESTAPDSQQTVDGAEPVLSVVIVTYNEADQVEGCIEAVFDACRDHVAFEVILVDSNSTDRTVEYALEYPITVLRIPSDDLTTPGAGRYVGTEYASGDRILFVDGDMLIEGAWLARALATLGGDVAGVDGFLDAPAIDDAVQTVDSIRGVALYDATALNRVGGFDPWLRALEDIELGYRMTEAGKRLLRLPDVAAQHIDDNGPREAIRRWHAGYYVGMGQVLRKWSTSPRMLSRFLSRARYRLGMGLWLAVGAVSLLVPTLFLLWAVGSIAAFAIVVSRLGPSLGVKFVLAKFLGLLGMVQGLLLRPAAPESFPLEEVDVLQRGPIHRPTGRQSPTVDGTRVEAFDAATSVLRDDELVDGFDDTNGGEKADTRDSGE